MIEFIEKMKIIILMLLEKYYFIEAIEFYCGNSDEKYYDEEYINLFLKSLKKL